MKRRILNAATAEQQLVAGTAIDAYIEKRGIEVAGKGIVFTIGYAGTKHAVEVRSTKRTVTAEVLSGHRRLTRLVADENR